MDFVYDNDTFSINIDGCFTPNLTTSLFADALLNFLANKNDKRYKILEVGCGSGVISVIANKYHPDSEFFLSDLSSSAINSAKINLDKYSVDNYQIKKSDLFAGWLEEGPFDIILNDISGISEDIAGISGWFTDVPANTGRDGIDLTVKALNDGAKILKNPESPLFFPVISLSNVKKTIDYAKSKYNYIEMVKSKDWPMPLEMFHDNKKLFEDLKGDGHIKYEEKFGMFICNTSIFMAQDPL